MDPDEPDPNEKPPDPKGKVPDPYGKVPDPNGKFGEPDDGEVAEGSEPDAEFDCQTTWPMPNPAAMPIKSNTTTNKTVVA